MGQEPMKTPISFEIKNNWVGRDCMKIPTYLHAAVVMEGKYLIRWCRFDFEHIKESTSS
jgi:hypothetical protein